MMYQWGPCPECHGKPPGVCSVCEGRKVAQTTDMVVASLGEFSVFSSPTDVLLTMKSGTDVICLEVSDYRVSINTPHSTIVLQVNGDVKPQLEVEGMIFGIESGFFVVRGREGG